jgi:hypothetical protein
MTLSTLTRSAITQPGKRFGNQPPRNLHQEQEQLARQVERENATMGYNRTIASSRLAQQVLNLIRELDHQAINATHAPLSLVKTILEAKGGIKCETRELELTLDALIQTGQLKRITNEDQPPNYTTRLID